MEMNGWFFFVLGVEMKWKLAWWQRHATCLQSKRFTTQQKYFYRQIIKLYIYTIETWHSAWSTLYYIYTINEQYVLYSSMEKIYTQQSMLLLQHNNQTNSAKLQMRCVTRLLLAQEMVLIHAFYWTALMDSDILFLRTSSIFFSCSFRRSWSAL